MLSAMVRRKCAFVVASSAFRFRRELRPLQNFEIHTECVLADDRQMHFVHIAREAGGERRALAGSIVRAVLRRGRETVSPRSVLLACTDDEQALPPAVSSGAEYDALATLERALSGEGGSQSAE
jgi:acyl-CoA thioesterase FadM